VRVVHLRIGMVVSERGGALAKMLTPFRLGAGGVIGSGNQWMSWISLDDLVGAIRWALATEALRGPVNAVAPAPVTNREFTRALARACSRTTRSRIARALSASALSQRLFRLRLA